MRLQMDIPRSGNEVLVAGESSCCSSSLHTRQSNTNGVSQPCRMRTGGDPEEIVDWTYRKFKTRSPLSTVHPVIAEARGLEVDRLDLLSAVSSTRRLWRLAGIPSVTNSLLIHLVDNFEERF